MLTHVLKRTLETRRRDQSNSLLVHTFISTRHALVGPFSEAPLIVALLVTVILRLLVGVDAIVVIPRDGFLPVQRADGLHGIGPGEAVHVLEVVEILVQFRAEDVVGDQRFRRVRLGSRRKRDGIRGLPTVLRTAPQPYRIGFGAVKDQLPLL